MHGDMKFCFVRHYETSLASREFAEGAEEKKIGRSWCHLLEWLLLARFLVHNCFSLFRVENLLSQWHHPSMASITPTLPTRKSLINGRECTERVRN